MFQKLIDLLLKDGFTIKARVEFTFERINANPELEKRFEANCPYCGKEIGRYAYSSGSSRALADHLKICEAKKEGTIESPNMIQPEDIPDWLLNTDESED